MSRYPSSRLAKFISQADTARVLTSLLSSIESQIDPIGSAATLPNIDDSVLPDQTVKRAGDQGAEYLLKKDSTQAVNPPAVYPTRSGVGRWIRQASEGGSGGNAFVYTAFPSRPNEFSDFFELYAASQQIGGPKTIIFEVDAEIPPKDGMWDFRGYTFVGTRGFSFEMGMTTITIPEGVTLSHLPDLDRCLLVSNGDGVPACMPSPGSYFHTMINGGGLCTRGSRPFIEVPLNKVWPPQGVDDMSLLYFIMDDYSVMIRDEGAGPICFRGDGEPPGFVGILLSKHSRLWPNVLEMPSGRASVIVDGGDCQGLYPPPNVGYWDYRNEATDTATLFLISDTADETSWSTTSWGRLLTMLAFSPFGKRVAVEREAICDVADSMIPVGTVFFSSDQATLSVENGAWLNATEINVAGKLTLDFFGDGETAQAPYAQTIRVSENAAVGCSGPGTAITLQSSIDVHLRDNALFGNEIRPVIHATEGTVVHVWLSDNSWLVENAISGDERSTLVIHRNGVNVRVGEQYNFLGEVIDPSMIRATHYYEEITSMVSTTSSSFSSLLEVVVPALSNVFVQVPWNALEVTASVAATGNAGIAITYNGSEVSNSGASGSPVVTLRKIISTTNFNAEQRVQLQWNSPGDTPISINPSPRNGHATLTVTPIMVSDESPYG